MEKLDSELCQWILLYIHYFNFLIFMHFTNQIKFQQSLAWKLTKETDIPLWTHMGHKEWSEDGNTFKRCCTIPSKFWDEFNANLFYDISQVIGQ